MSVRRSSTPFHESRDDDDPLLGWLRRDYLIAVSQETRLIPESLRAVLDGRSPFQDWLQQVHFRDEWLLAAADFTVTLWRERGYDGFLHMPVKALDLFQEYRVPGMLRLDLGYEWMAHRGQPWAQFRQGVMEEVAHKLEEYYRDSIAEWGKPQKQPSFQDLQLLARYQANQVKNPDETEYKRIVRMARRLALTLRPRNKRTKRS